MNEPLSTCCGAPPIGETHYVGGTPAGDVVGICNDCRDHAIFEDASPDEDERLLTMADGWQPIKTAPRDGEPFLAFEPHDMGGFMFVASYTKAERLVDRLEGTSFTYVTHWMPLPESPLSHYEAVTAVCRWHPDAVCIQRSESRHDVMASTKDDAQAIGSGSTSMAAWEQAARRIFTGTP